MTKRIFLVCLALVCLVLTGCGGKQGFAGSSRSPVESSEEQLAQPSQDTPVAVLSTSMGDILIVLFPQYAPIDVYKRQLHASAPAGNRWFCNSAENPEQIHPGTATAALLCTTPQTGCEADLSARKIPFWTRTTECNGPRQTQNLQTFHPFSVPVSGRMYTPH